MKLKFDRGGDGSRLLLLLHGMGATRHVWQPMFETAERRWQGSWLAPDLRGHGRSAHSASYAIGLHAGDVGELVIDTGPWDDIVVVGHSMGGMIALALASGWFAFAPARVFGLGIKVAWTKDELAALSKFASSPPRIFDTEEAAVDRYLKVSGLVGLTKPDAAMARYGVTRTEQGWRLASDPATASVGLPPMRALLAAARAPMHLARGKLDPLVSHDQLVTLDPEACDLAGLGHNAMVQSPDAVWRWIDERLA
ncbi:MAG: alpha/beta hydrolase [Rhizomicrobium sp.]|jgi:pimeloyl-ACP methyl ester carboxylesterase